MISLPIRTRIAPIALLVALAFVVIGFLRADREMAQAETDRAELTVSQTATLVEVFLLRHLTQLHVAERVLEAELSSNPPNDSNVATHGLNRATESITTFDTVWIADSGLTSVIFARSPNRNVLERIDHHRAGTPAVLGDSLGPITISNNGPRIIPTKTPNGGTQLYFVDASRRLGRTVVGAISADSLATLVQQSTPARSFSITVRAGKDTLLSLPGREVKQPQTLEKTISTPSRTEWTLLMSYTPSSRGVRIALWIVGLGAIIGLGIGLLLERREASRIADRSSELEHLSTELLRANRAKSEFLANVSHELRTPLNAIVGFVDLLRDGVYGALNSRQVGPVERIEASANHLRHLVDQILDLAKMAAGRLEVHAEPIELRPFVFDVASEVEPLMTEKGLSFSLAIGTTLPRVRTDPTHLRQILINLLGNAVKFTNTGGISIRGKLIDTDGRIETPTPTRSTSEALHAKSPARGIWIALQVADSGIGISKKDCERIFDEFEQVNAGPRGDSIRRGTGLGLSISRRLARLLGGDITVESELDRGSVFTVWLPVDPADLRGDKAA